MTHIDVNVDYIKAVNYSLHHNGIAVCQSLELKNTGDDELNDVQVHCSGSMIKEYDSQIFPVLNAGDFVRMTDFVIAPDAEQLVALTERVNTSFTISVSASGETVWQHDFPIELMAYDQWMGLSVQPQTIASFVTPNHPAVSALVVRASEILRQATGSPTFAAYMKDDPNDVHAQVAAVYEAVKQCGIVYRELPASFETLGQRVCMPHNVLENRLGNCLEMTVLMATALEAVGINSGFVFMQGHAFLGVWLVPDCYPYSLCDDPSWLEKQCSQGIDEMLVLECTCANERNISLDNAIRTANKEIADHGKFLCFIDVKRCRLEKYLPLPARIESNGKWTLETQVETSGHSNMAVTQHDRYDLTQLRESQRELTKFDIWERKLLDFSLRNTMLNLYLRKRAVQ